VTRPGGCENRASRNDGDPRKAGAVAPTRRGLGTSDVTAARLGYWPFGEIVPGRAPGGSVPGGGGGTAPGGTYPGG
jgi:hypothetical protein